MDSCLTGKPSCCRGRLRLSLATGCLLDPLKVAAMAAEKRNCSCCYLRHLLLNASMARREDAASVLRNTNCHIRHSLHRCEVDQFLFLLEASITKPCS